MENNGHSAKVRLQLRHITWVHIHAISRLLNTSAVIRKTNLKKGGNYIWTIHCLAKTHTILKDARFLLVTTKDMTHFKFLLMKVTNLVYLGNIE